MVLTTSSKGIKGKQHTVIQKGKHFFLIPLSPTSRHQHEWQQTHHPLALLGEGILTHCFFPTAFTGASVSVKMW